MLVNGRQLVLNCEGCMRSMNQCSVITGCHLLDLALDSILVEPEKLGFLVEASEGEGEELGYVRVVLLGTGGGGGGGQIHHRGFTFR